MSRSKPVFPVNACVKLDTLCQKTLTTMVQYTNSPEETLEMMFDERTLRISREAKDYITPASNTGIYSFPGIPGFDGGLHICFEGLYRATISCAQVKLAGARDATPLVAAILEAQRIYDKFQRIKAFLRWGAENATLSAIRYYFPPAVKLDPAKFREYCDLPTRFKDPPGIEKWLPIIQEALVTMAEIEFLPTDLAPRGGGRMWLHFPETSVTHSYGSGEVAYRSDFGICNL